MQKYYYGLLYFYSEKKKWKKGSLKRQKKQKVCLKARVWWKDGVIVFKCLLFITIYNPRLPLKMNKFSNTNTGYVLAKG